MSYWGKDHCLTVGCTRFRSGTPGRCEECNSSIYSIPKQWKPCDMLEEMAETFKERNAVYGDNYKMVGELLEILHPEGWQQTTKEDHELGHLWSLMIVKLSRFAISGLEHQDSVHDLAVYAAMIESILKNREEENE